MSAGSPPIRADASQTVALLRSAGLRVTPQRDAVLGHLIRHGEHLTATVLHERLAGGPTPTTLSTVHRTLVGLASVGILHAVPTHGGTAFGIAGHDHGHITCSRCAHTTDIDTVLPSDADLFGQVGFSTTQAELVIHGLCTPCSAAG